MSAHSRSDKPPTPKTTKEAYFISKRVIENMAPSLDLDENDIRRIMSGHDGGWNIRALVEATAVAALEARAEREGKIQAAIEKIEGGNLPSDFYSKQGIYSYGDTILFCNGLKFALALLTDAKAGERSE